MTSPTYSPTVSRTRLLSRPPVCIPDDLVDRTLPKASGVVTLPGHIAWSAPYTFDMDDRWQLIGMYQTVMTEGLDDDVRYYIDIDVLVELWDDLWLSPYVREAWSAWLYDRGLLDDSAGC